MPTSKKYRGNFSKKKEGETNTVTVGRQKRQHVRKNVRPRQHHHQVSQLFLFLPTIQSVPVQEQHRQQHRIHNNHYNNNQQNFERKNVTFDPIPMTYAKLYPSLVINNLIQPRNPPQTPEPLPWWFKPDLHCAFHQGAPDHDIENCYPLKHEVQKLIKSGMVSFEDRAPNVKSNLLPAHGNDFVNMVDGYLGNFRVFDVRHIRSLW